MKRRQFLQSAAAAVGAPLIPAPLLRGAAVSPAIYARAITYASSDEYFSPNHLLSTLGIEGTKGDAVLSQLKLDGLIGEMGNTGLMYSKPVYNKQAKIAAKALHDAYTANAGNKPADLIKQAQDKVKELSRRASEFLETEIDSELPAEDGTQINSKILDNPATTIKG
jgi:hypothetical protein